MHSNRLNKCRDSIAGRIKESGAWWVAVSTGTTFVSQPWATWHADSPSFHWVDVKVETRRPSPWSSPAATLAYSPSTHVLWRGSEFVRLYSSGEESFPWAVLFGGLGGAAVVLPAAFVARRRRME